MSFASRTFSNTDCNLPVTSSLIDVSPSRTTSTKTMCRSSTPDACPHHIAGIGLRHSRSSLHCHTQAFGCKAIIVEGLVAQMSAFERIPVSGKNLLEDASSPQRVLPPPGRTELGYWHVYGKAILPRLTNAVHPSSGCPGGPSTSFILKR